MPRRAPFGSNRAKLPAWRFDSANKWVSPKVHPTRETAEPRALTGREGDQNRRKTIEKPRHIPHPPAAADFPSCHSERSERGPRPACRLGQEESPYSYFVAPQMRSRNLCQAPPSVQKPSISHHPDTIETSASLQPSSVCAAARMLTAAISPLRDRGCTESFCSTRPLWTRASRTLRWIMRWQVIAALWTQDSIAAFRRASFPGRCRIRLAGCRSGPGQASHRDQSHCCRRRGLG